MGRRCVLLLLRRGVLGVLVLVGVTTVIFCCRHGDIRLDVCSLMVCFAWCENARIDAVQIWRPRIQLPSSYLGKAMSFCRS